MNIGRLDRGRLNRDSWAGAAGRGQLDRDRWETAAETGAVAGCTLKSQQPSAWLGLKEGQARIRGPAVSWQLLLGRMLLGPDVAR